MTKVLAAPHRDYRLNAGKRDLYSSQTITSDGYYSLESGAGDYLLETGTTDKYLLEASQSVESPTVTAHFRDYVLVADKPEYIE